MKFFKVISKKIKSFFVNNINGTKGVISLFLAILMVPFVTLASALIDSARLNSAVALFDEALCNASNSTLGTYDQFLRKRFGLLAISQDPTSHVNYSSKDFVSELFSYYMEQNLSVISNTYETSEVSASGVYPLADTDVLLTQVLENGKYTVPAKLLVDGFNLEEILSNLTESLSTVTSIFDTVGAGANMVSSLDKCQEKLDDAVTKLNAYDTAKTNYETAYKEFKEAVNNYNTLIDTAKTKIAEAQTTLNNANTELRTCTNKVTEEASKPEVASILGQIDAINDEVKKGTKTRADANKEIEKLKKDNKDTLKSYNDAVTAKNTASTKVTNARNNLANVKEKYRKELETQRGTVRSEKTEYATAIGAFKDACSAAGTAVKDAQDSMNDVVSSAVDFGGNVVSTVNTAKKNATDKQIETLKDNQQAALDRGDRTAAYLWGDQIDETKQIKISQSNSGTLEQSVVDGIKEGNSAVQDFADQEYYEAFSSIATSLSELKIKVQGYTIYTDTSTKLASTSAYYLSNIVKPVSASNIESLMTELAGNVVSSGFSTIVKALKGFIDAMFNISFTYDPDLVANIDTSKYSTQGGLPSKRSRTQYSLDSGFAEADAQKSSQYKELLGAYTSSSDPDASVSAFDEAINAIKADFNTIVTCLDEISWKNFFKKLGEMFKAVGDIFVQIGNAIGAIVNTFTGSGIFEKGLLVGYIAYNTPNRTTCNGKALTGASYNLPKKDTSIPGYAFSGAETEYIINGSLSEKTNQEAIFTTIFFIRLLFNVPFVFMNSEVGSIATQAGACTCGVGTVVVYALYIFAEPILDALIVVNGGDVPIIKTKLYLTPSGVVNLVQAFTKLKLNDDQKNTMYKSVVETMTGDEKFASNYADAVSAFGTTESVLDKISFNYTKMMMMLMLLKKSDTLLDRLADVIQMEGSYNAVYQSYDPYSFNIDKSYTYIRASGTFSATPFIQMTDSMELTTSERVVYRGY